MLPLASVYIETHPRGIGGSGSTMGRGFLSVSVINAATIRRSSTTSVEGWNILLSLDESEISVFPDIKSLMWFFIMKIASLVNVLSAGQSWEMLFSFPTMTSNSRKLWVDFFEANLCRSAIRLYSFSLGRDHVNETVSKRTP